MITNSVLFIILLASLLIFSNNSLRAIGLISLLLLSFGSSFFLLMHKNNGDSVIYEKESYYGNIRISKVTDRAQRIVYEYMPSKVLIHSELYPDEPLRDLIGLIYLMPAMLNSPKNILVLGSAAGGVIRQIEMLFPDARVTGVDIDPEIHQVAKDIFKVDLNKSTLISRDARVYLSETVEKYDFIILDVFSGEFIPLHCITIEFFNILQRRLTSDGLVYINTNMNDIYFELPSNQETFRPIRHLISTLNSAGFKSIFENRFFHSLYAHPHAMQLADMKVGLLRQLSKQSLYAAARAVSGLVAYTTVSVPESSKGYRVYSDTWTPGFLIELKSNEQQIYKALKKHFIAGSDVAKIGAPVAGSSVAQLVLGRILDEGHEFGLLLSMIRKHGQLIERLNELESPLSEADWELAAKYFRFTHQLSTDGNVMIKSAWARVAALYAQMYHRAHDNAYESLLETIDSLRQSVVDHSGQ